MHEPSLPLSPATHITTGGRRGLSVVWVCLLITFVFLVLGGSGLTYYTIVFHPAELNAQATAVVQTLVSSQMNATVQAHTQATATAAVITPQAIYTQATSGNPVINDPMNKPDANSWVNYTGTRNTCTFTGGLYHAVVTQSGAYNLCLAEATRFHNFAFQVQMTLVKGDSGGLIFRADDKHYTFYRFVIDRNGFYSLFVLNNNSTEAQLTNAFSTAINTGVNISNTLTVITRDNDIFLYANGQFLAHVTDHTISTGKIGVSAFGLHSTEVIFSHVQVWNL